jgi:hypothetical protein
MGGKGVGAEFHRPMLAHWRSPVPSLRLEHGVVLPSKQHGLENAVGKD